LGVFDDLKPHEKYLYHYTGPDKLALILLNETVRLSPYSNMRDPRENSAWRPAFTSSGEGDESEIDVFQLWQDLDAALRQRAKMACFTMDRAPRNPDFPTTARGWARARMWEQYADRHRGAVLIFDHARLEATMADALGDGMLVGPVDYTEGPWKLPEFQPVSLTDVRTNGVGATAERLIESGGSQLFFQKDVDWEGETEYRYVTISDEPYESVKVLSALLGIVVGQDFPDHEDRGTATSNDNGRCWGHTCTALPVDERLPAGPTGVRLIPERQDIAKRRLVLLATIALKQGRATRSRHKAGPSLHRIARAGPRH
jgi:hypothetical protein